METASRAGRDMGGSNIAARALAPSEPSTLDRITDRILSAARAAQEIGHKLHEHADMVHGPIPENRAEVVGTDRPQAAIERIYQALNELDAAQSYMAEGAGRNTTLA